MPEYTNMKVDGVMHLDISAFAHQLEMDLADILLPEPKGIYLKTRVEPVMVDGKNYYTRNGVDSTLVVDINVTKENIYDENDKLIIPKSYLLKKSKWLSNEPFLPYYGVKILENFVNYDIDQFVQYRKSTMDRRSRNLDFFERVYWSPTVEDPEGIFKSRMDEAERQMDTAFLPIRQELEWFLGKNDWHMYFVHMNNCELVVERFCDYRIYMWEQEHGEEFRADRLAEVVKDLQVGHF